MEGSGYAFADREQEQQRLRSQAELFDPLTERAFAAAGLGAGMRVLDLGSGAGDVAMLATRLVGSGGEVVGVERDPAAVASASARVRRQGSPTSASCRATRRRWMDLTVRSTRSLAGLSSCTSLTRGRRSHTPPSSCGPAAWCASRRVIWPMSGRSR